MTAAPVAMFIAPSAFPLGGLSTWLNYLLPGLATRGWRPVLGLVAGDHHDVQAYTRANPATCPVVAISNRTGSQEGRIRSLASAIADAGAAITVGVNIVDTYPAVARIRETGGRVKAAMSLHGIQPDLIADACSFRDTLEAVVCTNRLAAALVEDAGVSPRKIHYAPYGVDLREGPTPARSTAHRLRIAYVGRIEESQKRTSDLFPICDELVALGVDFELLVAGSGPDELALHAALRSHVAAGRVRFLGALDASRLEAEVYRQTDILLLTSHWETGPLVVWEAMAQGLAVVSSRYIGSGLEGALQDGSNALMFAIGNCTEAADCISRLRSAELRARLVEAGRALVAARYSREHSVAAWDRCLRQIAEAPPIAAKECAFPPFPSGRLDRWFGTRPAESLRRLGGLRHRHSEPGGEWPHTHNAHAPGETGFWQRAARLDAGAP
jgi:glycosyltransferase involved in cell wall biosynthesis